MSHLNFYAKNDNILPHVYFTKHLNFRAKNEENIIVFDCLEINVARFARNVSEWDFFGVIFQHCADWPFTRP